MAGKELCELVSKVVEVDSGTASYILLAIYRTKSKVLLTRHYIYKEIRKEEFVVAW